MVYKFRPRSIESVGDHQEPLKKPFGYALEVLVKSVNKTLKKNLNRWEKIATRWNFLRTR